MARENQGLQIALIVFVVFAIVLGVTTYIGFKNADEAQRAKAAADDSKAKSDKDLIQANSDIEDLKRMIGFGKAETITTVQDAFKKDMAAAEKGFGAGLVDDARHYHPILEKMQKTIADLNNQLTDAKGQIPLLKKKHEDWEKTREQQLKQYEEEKKKALDDLAAMQTEYNAERDRMKTEAKKMSDDLTAIRKEIVGIRDKARSEVKKADERMEMHRRVAQEQSEKIEKLTVDRITTPNGEISWVNQRNGTVWINLGRADALTRQITFSVWPSDITSMTAVAKKKASIEVTQIISDHLAEARIIDDTPTNPILPGDKIFTPLWSAGAKRHFALLGLMDANGDGKSDLQTVLNLITANGGVVDCYVADTGKNKDKPVGQITVNTNCIIMGSKPNETSNAQQVATFSKLLGEANELRIQKKQLSDFLQQVGWKDLSNVVHYGKDANPNDFRAKPENGYQEKSSGSVSSLFQKRQPGDTTAPATTTPANTNSSTPKSSGGRAGGMYYKY